MPDEHAATFEDLQRGLPPYSLAGLRFGLLRAASRAGASLSEGLRIGHARGFDSGPFMSYVYDDRPHGRTPVGTWLDRRLLSRPTCRAFREIKLLAEQAVNAAIAAQGAGAVVADLAAGPAPYVLDALAEHPDATAVICDIDEPRARPGEGRGRGARAGRPRARAAAGRVRRERAGRARLRRRTSCSSSACTGSTTTTP